MNTINQANQKLSEQAQELVTAKIGVLAHELTLLLRDYDGSMQQAIDIEAAKPECDFSNKDSVIAWSKYYDANSDAMAIYSVWDKLEGLVETQKLNLMFCPCEYVVTNETLVSPRGFNSCDRVFVQTGIAIHIDERPTTKNIPSFANAKVYNVAKWEKEGTA